jgi:hypothetical protein
MLWNFLNNYNNFLEKIFVTNCKCTILSSASFFVRKKKQEKFDGIQSREQERTSTNEPKQPWGPAEWEATCMHR